MLVDQMITRVQVMLDLIEEEIRLADRDDSQSNDWLRTYHQGAAGLASTLKPRLKRHLEDLYSLRQLLNSEQLSFEVFRKEAR